MIPLEVIYVIEKEEQGLQSWVDVFIYNCYVQSLCYQNNHNSSAAMCLQVAQSLPPDDFWTTCYEDDEIDDGTLKRFKK